MEALRLGIFVATYILIAVQQLPGLRVNRPAASLLGAVAMVVVGGLPLHDAYAAVDMDVIVFLLGVLLLAAYLELGNFFEWAAARVVRRMHSPRTVLAGLVATSGLLSALFINDTICLVLTPLVLAAVRPLGLAPLPYLLAVALAANVGSVMTLIGNPQNMLVGVASGIGFARFTGAMLVPGLGGLVIVYLVLARVHRRDLDMPLAAPEARLEVALDRPLVTKALIVFGGALVGWLAGLSLPLVAISAAAVMIAVAQRDPAEAFARVEWSLLLFFAAIFVVMRGVGDLPVMVTLTERAVAQLHGTPWRDAGTVTLAMVALSNLVSNVPAVALWLPVMPKMADAEFVWLLLALTATLAGNLTLLGSMANLIVAERAASHGVRVSFLSYLRVGVPVTVLTLLWGVATLVLLRR